MNLRIAAAGIFVALTALASARTIDLSGDWKVELDNDTTTHLITLPGTTDLAGLGVPNVLEPELKKPQLLRLTRKNRFIGRATYSRTVHIDGDMAGKPLELKFEDLGKAHGGEAVGLLHAHGGGVGLVAVDVDLGGSGGGHRVVNTRAAYARTAAHQGAA